MKNKRLTKKRILRKNDRMTVEAYCALHNACQVNCFSYCNAASAAYLVAAADVSHNWQTGDVAL
jgi:hypothetical protein